MLSVEVIKLLNQIVDQDKIAVVQGLNGENIGMSQRKIQRTMKDDGKVNVRGRSRRSKLEANGCNRYEDLRRNNK